MSSSPDYVRAVVLRAKYGSQYIDVVVDSSGQFYALLKGYTGSVYVPLKVDATGQLFTLLQGYNGTTYIPIKVDTDGNIISLLTATDGSTLRTVKTDTSGQLIIIPKGASGVDLLVDANGYMFSVLKGSDGGVLRTVSVDASGNLVAVMKANYSGTLTTVKCDVDGRITTYLADTQDLWGQIVNVGNAELAARLGSERVFDRRGETVLQESFENGINGWSHVSPTTATGWRISNGAARGRGLSAKCVTAATSGLSYTLYRYLNPIFATCMGIEVAFAFPTSNAFVFTIQGSYYDGVNRYDMICYWQSSDKKWYITQALGDTAVTPAIEYVRSSLAFYHAKLTCDFSSGLYEKLLYGPNSVDLVSWTRYSEADVTAPGFYVAVDVLTAVAAATTVYVDLVNVTQNEPIT